MLSSPFEKIVRDLLNATKKVDKSITSLKQISAKIDEKYHPRAEFERWRDSIDGQTWKQKQYIAQKSCCAICQKSINLKGSHIDHKKPLSLYPELALDLNNLQVTCPECNVSKGDRLKNSNGGNDL